jgi:hypothetical protein
MNTRKTANISVWEMQKNMSDFLNENTFGSPNKLGSYRVTMDQKTGDLWEVKFNDSVAKKLEVVLMEKVLPKFLAANQKVDKWQECCKILIEIMKILKKRDDFTDQNIHETELKITDWLYTWLKCIHGCKLRASPKHTRKGI